jgi:hypothetical protein
MQDGSARGKIVITVWAGWNRPTARRYAGLVRTRRVAATMRLISRALTTSTAIAVSISAIGLSLTELVAAGNLGGLRNAGVDVSETWDNAGLTETGDPPVRSRGAG